MGRGHGGDSCPLSRLCSSAAPAVGAPPGSGLEAAGDTAALRGCERVLLESPSRSGQPSAPQTSVPVCCPRGSRWHRGATQAGGGRVTPPVPAETRSLPGRAHGAVCPSADAVAARKCFHGDGRSRAQGWRNTSGSGWWGEGLSGEGPPGMGDGQVSSLFTSGREAFKPRPRGSEALVASGMRGSPGVWHPRRDGTGCVTPRGAGTAGGLCHPRVAARPCVCPLSPC